NPHSMRRTPYPQRFRGAASGHARLRYAGGSWRSSRRVGLRIPMRSRCFNGEPAARSDGDRAIRHSRQDAGNDCHVPATRTARLPDVVVQGTSIVVHGVPVKRAIGVNVGNLVMMRTGFVVQLVASEAVVVVA